MTVNRDAVRVQTCTECRNQFTQAVNGHHLGRRKLTCSPRCKADRANRLSTERRRDDGIGPVRRMASECIVKGCFDPPQARDLCSMHYARAWRTGVVGPADKLVGLCWVQGCEDEVATRGLCALHYQRYLVTGESGPLRRKKRTSGQGTVMPKGYIRVTRPDGTRIDEQRFVMEQVIGRELLPEETVHHKNGDRSDNRIVNLELWSSAQPAGQRVVDKLAYAREIIARYENLPPEAV